MELLSGRGTICSAAAGRPSGADLSIVGQGRRCGRQPL
ncbi:hypothetical protein T261_5003 [Streptomyces lydicus]|nr:hypothetical protein T261_5003 [Streptomyces lydicus]